jgi:hypothetical protein
VTSSARMLRVSSWSIAVLLLGSACKQESPAPAAAPTKTQVDNAKPSDADLKTVGEFLKKDAPAQDPTAALPPGHPPMNGAAAPAGAALPPNHPAVPGMDAPAGDDALAYTAPAEWKSQPVTSNMRKAQFLLPRAAGDQEDGQMIVFYFGQGQGGSVEGNISRWQGMFSSADGKPVPASAVKRASREVGGMKVTTLDIVGRYVDPMAGGGAGSGPQKDSRMLAAIVETPQGPWFFKGVGPVATMKAQLDSFNKLVASFKKK